MKAIEFVTVHHFFCFLLKRNTKINVCILLSPQWIYCAGREHKFNLTHQNQIRNCNTHIHTHIHTMQGQTKQGWVWYVLNRFAYIFCVIIPTNFVFHSIYHFYTFSGFRFYLQCVSERQLESPVWGLCGCSLCFGQLWQFWSNIFLNPGNKAGPELHNCGLHLILFTPLNRLHTAKPLGVSARSFIGKYWNFVLVTVYPRNGLKVLSTSQKSLPLTTFFNSPPQTNKKKKTSDWFLEELGFCSKCLLRACWRKTAEPVSHKQKPFLSIAHTLHFFLCI